MRGDARRPVLLEKGMRLGRELAVAHLDRAGADRLVQLVRRLLDRVAEGVAATVQGVV